MKKYILSVISVALCCVLMIPAFPFESFAAGNPYPTSQTYPDGDTALPCTWAVWDQANKALGIEMPGLGNGGCWAHNVQGKTQYIVDNIPSKDSVIVWTKPEYCSCYGGDWGHVAYVTDIDANYIYIVEGGVKGSRSVRSTQFSIYDLNRAPGYYFQGFVHLKPVDYSPCSFKVEVYVDGVEYPEGLEGISFNLPRQAQTAALPPQKTYSTEMGLGSMWIISDIKYPADYILKTPTDAGGSISGQIYTDTVLKLEFVTPKALKSVSYNGSMYEYYKANDVDWNSANQFAESKGGKLVAITSPDEQRFVADNNPVGACWTGGYDYTRTASFKWTGGDGWVYTNWYNNGHFDITAGDGYFIYMAANGTWVIASDSHCTGMGGFIVEYNHTHTPENVAAVPATCTTGGTKAGVKCSQCGAVISGIEPTGALGHDYVETKVAATCTKAGYLSYTCSRCKETYTKDPELSYDYSAWSETKPTAAPGSEIETATQYRKRTLKSNAAWSDWTNWSNVAVNPSDTREVEKKEEAVDYTMISVKARNKNGMVCYLPDNQDGYTALSDAKIEKWSLMDVYSSRQIAPGTQISVDGSAYEMITGPGMSYFSMSERQPFYILSQNTVTYYRYRDKTSSSGVSDWSDWSFEAAADSADTEVETRTVYRTKTADANVAARGHSWDNGKINESAGNGKNGVITYTCTVCRATRNEELAAHTEHVWDDGTITTPITCKEEGVRTYKCIVCGQTKTENLTKTDVHKWDKGKEEKNGSVVFTCEICGLKRTETGEAHTEHIWDDGKTITPATCKNEGVMLFTCRYCGQTKTEKISKLSEHMWDSGEITTPATCKDAGVRTYKCAVCGETKTEKIEKTDIHSWDEGKTAANGDKVFTCKVCGITRTEKARAHTEHIWDDGTVEISATCGNEGSVIYRCRFCGETKTEKIAKLGEHRWNAGAVTTPATCKDDGIRIYTCSVCGKTKTEVIEKTGTHEWDQGKTAGNGDMVFTCLVCGTTRTEKSAGHTEHVWDYGTVITPATCKSEGVIGYACKYCGEIKTEPIPVNEDHKWDSGKITTPATPDNDGIITYTCTVCGKTRTEPLPSGFSLGDVDHDGKITSNDARLALRIAADLLIPSPEQLKAADLNGDGKVRASEVRKILRVAARLESSSALGL